MGLIICVSLVSRRAYWGVKTCGGWQASRRRQGGGKLAGTGQRQRSSAAVGLISGSTKLVRVEYLVYRGEKMIETTSEGDAWAPDGPRTPPRLKRVGHGVFEPPAKNEKISCGWNGTRIKKSFFYIYSLDLILY